jgi:hypothetical protein
MKIKEIAKILSNRRRYKLTQLFDEIQETNTASYGINRRKTLRCCWFCEERTTRDYGSSIYFLILNEKKNE